LMYCLGYVCLVPGATPATSLPIGSREVLDCNGEIVLASDAQREKASLPFPTGVSSTIGASSVSVAVDGDPMLCARVLAGKFAHAPSGSSAPTSVTLVIRGTMTRSGLAWVPPVFQ